MPTSSSILWTSLAVLAGHAALASAASIRAGEAHAAAQETLSPITGSFRIVESMRCQGHYNIARGATTVEECARLCEEDDQCSSFSIQAEGGKGCFMYSQETVCQTEQGWSSGRKDTTSGLAAQDTSTTLKCPYGMVISEIKFASYGTPTGSCHSFELGSCHEETTKEVVEDLCLGEAECTLSASSHVFGEPCNIVDKNLKVEIGCVVGQAFYEDVYFNAWSSRHWPKALSEVDARANEWKGFLEALPDYPQNKYSGKGIIVVAGGRYLEPAVVMINMIRKLGSTLRIQVWHVGDEEMTPAHRKILEPYNVETRDFKDFVGPEMLKPIQANVGMRLFQLKPLALLHSDLEDILLLDSDNCPVKDPSFLFETKEFQETGSLFWPDYWQTSLENPIWQVVGRTPEQEWEQESGQLVIHKETAWKAVNLAVYFNSDFYMKLLNGDKDTFRFSWVAADVPYTMVNTLPTPIGTLKELHSKDVGFCSHTMLQHDLEGNPLFVHHNQIKHAVLAIGENFKYQKLPGTATTFRAVPVEGLHLASGTSLSCIDLQSPDSDDANSCVVSESGLEAFEANYFAAQATIPSGAFTAKELAAPSLLGNDGGKLLQKHRAQMKLQQSVMERLRRDTNTTCSALEFEVIKPTLENDRICETATICAGAEAVAPTPTSDRVCTATAKPATKSFAVRLAEKTSAHPYFKYGAETSIHVKKAGDDKFTDAPEIRLTRLENYEFSIDGSMQEHPFMLTLDAVGGAESNPYMEGVHGSAAAGDKTLSFSPGPNTPSMLYYQSQAATHMGWRVHVTDPTFTVAYAGKHVGSAHKRFATAFSKDAVLYEEKDSESNYDNVRGQCQKRCSIMPQCRGVHIYRAAKVATCTGLNDVSGEAQSTTLDSLSIAKVVY